MGKESSNNNNAKPRNNKPYDVSHSFVKKITNRLSGYFGSFFPATNGAETAILPSEERDDPNNLLRDVRIADTGGINDTTANDAGKMGNYHLSGDVLPSSAAHQRRFISPIRNEPVAGPSGIPQDFFLNKRSLTQSESSTAFPSKFMRCDGDSLPIKSLQQREWVSRGAGDDRSESSESTSGCSSLVPQADRMSQSAFISSRKKSLTLEDKLNYARQLKMSRSAMYLNRSIPVHMDTPRPSRIPAFDASAYGSPILNKSSVREAMLNSPFYSGHTTYGGASARRNSLCTSGNRPQIPVKPAAAAPEDVNMSHTARKILAALEEFSTPLRDARRIPPPAPPLAAKRRALEPTTTRPPKLPALTVPVVADLIKIRRLEQIQESTAAARLVVNQAIAATDSQPRRHGKVVTKLKDRDKPPIDEPPPPPIPLPKLSLPISSLPKFDIQPLPTPTPISENKYTFSAPSEIDYSTSYNKNVSKLSNFAFSPPVTPSEWVMQITIPSIANFTSEALSKLKRKPAKQPESLSTLSPAPALKSGSVMDILKQSELDRPMTIVTSPSDPRTFEKRPIVLASEANGIGDNLKPLPGSWSCDTCLVRNSALVSKCIACETPKQASSRTGSHVESQPAASSNSNPPFRQLVPSGFGMKFKPPADSWCCTTCLVNNKSTVHKCMACETEKPGPKPTGDKVKPLGPASCSTCGDNNVAGSKCIACQTSEADDEPVSNGPSANFGDLCKQPLGTWASEPMKPISGIVPVDSSVSWVCSVCLIKNKGDAVKCVACENPMPNSGIPSKESQSTTWECSVCLVKNNGDAGKCVACENSKPNSSFRPADSITTWECSVCLVKNIGGAVKCVACETTKPNCGNRPAESGTKFSFGIPSEASQFKFGVPQTSNSIQLLPNGPSKLTFPPTVSTPTLFSFGIPSAPPPHLGNDVASSESGILTKGNFKTKPLSVAETATSENPGVERKAIPPVFAFGLNSSHSANSSALPSIQPTPVADKVNMPTAAFGFNGSVVSKPVEFTIPSKPADSSCPPFSSASATSSFVNPFANQPKVEPSVPPPVFGGVGNVSNTLPAGIFTFGSQKTAPEAKPTPFKGFGFAVSNTAPGPVGTTTGNSHGHDGLTVSNITAFSASTATPVSSSTMPAFNSSQTLAFGRTLAPAFGNFGTPPANAPNPFNNSNSITAASFGSSAAPAASPFGAPFGQISAPTSVQPQSPFQFSASSVQFSAAATPTQPSSFSLSVPPSFNFTGGQTPAFSATPLQPEPTRRRIIKARRTQR